VKLVFVTDVHCSEKGLDWMRAHGREYDAVVVGGDLAKGSSQAFVNRFLEAALESNRKLFYVFGNSDSPKNELPKEVAVLHGEKVRQGGYTMGGLGGSNKTPFNTPFELEDQEADEILAKLGKVDILVSHCPPAGSKCDRSPAGHIGSAPVRKYVESFRPMLVLSGHVHEGRGVDNLDGTTVVNPGPLFDGNYAEVTLDGILSVELKTERLGG
jgi:uncharacterized protein